MHWDDLQFVLAVSRASTLTAAARQLGVARTTVGRRIHALEEALGARLFDDTAEGLLPTAAGQLLAESAQRVEAEVLSATARLAGQDAVLEGNLRVSTVDFVFECFEDAFASFIEAYPGVTLSVLSTDEEVSLRRREADIAVRMKDAPPDTLVGRKLGDVTFHIYAARDLVARVGQDAHPRAFPWLRYDARHDDRGLDPWYGRFADGAPVAMGFDSYNVMRQAVCAGIGAHFLPRFDAERFDHLVCLGPEVAPTRSLWALTVPELRKNSRVRAFLQHLDTALRPRIR